MFELYRTLTSIGGPLISWHLARRAKKGKEDPQRKAERKGVASRSRPEGPLIWFHAASVGESASIMPLIERLQKDMPDLNILLTTGTVTSAKLCEQRLSGKAFHQYVPVDRGAWVARFLDHWKPDLALWVESEFWPNLLYQLKTRNIPTVLVNARMSVKSYARWMKAAKTARNLLDCFDLCLVPDHVMADRLRDFGVNRVTLTGNLKDASPPLAVDEQELVDLAKAIGSRPVWIAASTHPGEEGLAEHVHEHLTADYPKLLTIIAPRHPDRGSEIVHGLRQSGKDVAVRSLGDPLTDHTEFYVADTLGELGLIYRLATVVFVGGSLVPHGGQNLREPARLRSAILHGPHIANFANVARELGEVGAARQVENEDALTRAVSALLSEPAAAEAMATGAGNIVDKSENVLDQTVQALEPYLSPLRRSMTPENETPENGKRHEDA
ncbi:MAG: 3-deoxy-D-manno-octulosonic acid transferase [Alphaproteobacteria bacterium]|jgi:3-deoxy-D-manno-octulosonic-acid transferase|nr:3-deoxy-D-manno-octulosonic acid transferase [Alphaproteobacteria bacterium]MBT4965938.1 3-deoxy-D-manno-octulosonic acid transferase [Alphaproteobacteria bacterium]MBT5159127.1 3-deoxy-D-manno-octulosonic acid transferase [Alphaproteobacteria bacterium]MBT5916907.1 3-deoxy-D-manno-octulosonic acid transferase [Alphaproteobacteria bacterium]MBT6386899.1 3-deoxy-D-manno-octulosonic acid transferase [Alphaproteobacteria bacterium]